MRVTPVAEVRDESTRCQTTTLRYERISTDGMVAEERPWLLHWHTQAGFRELAAAADLDVRTLLTPDAEPAAPRTKCLSRSSPPRRQRDSHDMTEMPSKQELESAHCWEADDHVPRRPAMTEFRRRLRYHQAQWREANGHPIGSQPIAPREGARARPVGNRLPFAYAKETGANFLTATAPTQEPGRR